MGDYRRQRVGERRYVAFRPALEMAAREGRRLMRRFARPAVDYVAAPLLARGVEMARNNFYGFPRQPGRMAAVPRSGAAVRDARSNRVRVVRKKRRGRNKKSLKKRIRAIERVLPKMSTHDFRQATAGFFRNAENQCVYGYILAQGHTDKEEGMNALTHLNRSVAPVVATHTIDATQANFEYHKMKFTNWYVKVVFRNNHSIPVIIDVYTVKYKTNTTINPTDTVVQDAAAHGVANMATNILAYPTDNPVFNQKLKILKHTRQQLNGGDELKVYYTDKESVYDPGQQDAVNYAYMKGEVYFLIRLQGIVSHDTADRLIVGSGDGKVDFNVFKKFKVRYQGDLGFHRNEFNVAFGNQAGGAEAAGPNIQENMDDN